MSEAPAPSRRRASDLLALALVATSVVVVTVAAAPSVARELGLTSASISRRELPRRAGDEIGSPRRHDGRGLGVPDLVAPPDDLVEDDDEVGPGDARLAVAVRDLVVREIADERAASLGEVPRGELLIVIREAGAWAMVAHLGGEGSTTGWVRRGDLAIR
jgi:hypothetical protein